MEPTFEIRAEWAQVSHSGSTALREVYGFAGSAGAVNLEGIRFLPEGKASSVLLIYMHPASHAAAAAGAARDRPQQRRARAVRRRAATARNDTPLIIENVVLDLGAYIRHAREVWGYEQGRARAAGRGGGSLALLLPVAGRAADRSRRRRPATRRSRRRPG